jgi:hypothetical protein
LTVQTSSSSIENADRKTFLFFDENADGPSMNMLLLWTKFYFYFIFLFCYFFFSECFRTLGDFLPPQEAGFISVKNESHEKFKSFSSIHTQKSNDYRLRSLLITIVQSVSNFNFGNNRINRMLQQMLDSEQDDDDEDTTAMLADMVKRRKMV